ncbi:MAG: DUF2752 domain-containing protein [Acidimicrobiia bacterium]
MGSDTPEVARGRFGALPPLASAVLGVGALGVVFAADPATSRGYLRCPLHEMTGLWCPGCGVTRATYKALHGDVLGALGTNLFLPVFAVLVVAGWLTWFLPTIERRPPLLVARAPAGAWVALGASLLLFAVLRNLPYAPLSALAP